MRAVLLCLVLTGTTAACENESSITRSTSTTPEPKEATRDPAADLRCPDGVKPATIDFEAIPGSGTATPDEAMRPYADGTWRGRTITEVERTESFALFRSAEGDVVIYVEEGDGRWAMTRSACAPPG